MSESYTPNKNSRRFRMPRNPWIPYVGDCKAVNTYLDSKSGLQWAVPKFLNAFFRGFSQVVFANNPLTGLIILLALLWADPMVGLAGSLTATTAIITSVIFYQDEKAIQAGLTTFNAVLVGTVPVALWESLTGEPVPGKLWWIIIAGAIFSVFVTTALANMFASFRLPLPCLTFPFNIVAMLLFSCFLTPPHALPTGGNVTDPSEVVTRIIRDIAATTMAPTESPLQADDPGLELTDADANRTTDGNADDFDPNQLVWGNILSGVLLSMGQVFGINNVFSSILMFIAVMIYSPIMCLMSLVGSVIGNVAGLLFTASPYDAVYNGLWGFNAILSASAVGGYFLVLTCHSFWIAVANVLFTVGIQQALTLALKPAGIPAFTLPFVLSTLIFLSFSATKGLPRVINFSFPEWHRFEYLEQRRQRQAMQTDAEENPEEKELVLKDVKVISDEVIVDEKEKEKSDENNIEGKKIEVELS